MALEYPLSLSASHSPKNVKTVLIKTLKTLSASILSHSTLFSPAVYMLHSCAELYSQRVKRVENPAMLTRSRIIGHVEDRTVNEPIADELYFKAKMIPASHH